MAGMSLYVRPAFDTPVFRDADGEVIAYGSRWEDSPPADSYSVTSNPERFEPLHTVADALIAWLAESFDAEILDGLEAAGDLLHAHPHAVRAVRVTPRAVTAAPLTFVFTSFPGVLLHAGALWDSPFPVCGCDACDDDVERVVDDLEWTVQTVASGGFEEEYRQGDDLPIRHRLSAVGVGSRSGERVDDIDPDRRRAAIAMLASRDAWGPWPQRR